LKVKSRNYEAVMCGAIQQDIPVMLIVFLFIF